MNRTPVSSSYLSSVGYDHESNILEIKFNNGRVFQYHGVPQYIYTGLISSISPGEYFHENIKNSFQYTSV